MARMKAVRATGLMGVNLLDAPEFLDDNELQRSENLFPRQQGLLRKRLGLGPIYSGLGASYGKPCSMVTPPFDSELAAAWVERATGSSTGATAWAMDSVGGSLASGSWSERPSRYPILLPAFGKVYAFFGHPGDPFGSALVLDPAAVTPWDYFRFQGTNNGFWPAGACIYKSRMVFWDLDSAGYLPSSIVTADYGDPTLIGDDVRAANGRFLPFWPESGDRIVTCAEVTPIGAGNPPESVLLVLKEYSGGIMSGEQGNAAGTVDDSLTVNRFSFDVGCASHHTLCHTPYGTIWASHDDVWILEGPNQIPRRIGSKIRSVLQRTPAAQRFLWHAAYTDDGVYRLAVFSDDGQEHSDEAACGEQWWLDLRSGAPQSHKDAKWYGPMKFKLYNGRSNTPLQGTRTMAVDQRPGRDRTLYGMEWGIGNYHATSKAFCFVAYDKSTGYDFSATVDNSTVYQSYLDNCEITSELRTKAYDFGDDEVDKVVTKAEAAPSVNMGTRMAVDFVCDGGRDISTGEESIAPQGFQADVSLLDSATVMYDARTPTAFEPDVSERHYGNLVEAHVRDRPGYVITSDLTTIVLSTNPAGPSVNCTLTAGYYATIGALLDMLVAAMSTALSDTVVHFQNNVPRPVYVTIQASTVSWQFAANDLATKTVFAMLGYDTSSTPALATAQTAATSVLNKRSAQVEYTGVNLFAHPITRRPV